MKATGFLFFGIIFLLAFRTFGESKGFDEDEVKKIPQEWRCGVTGKGKPTWEVRQDSTAPSSPNVLSQSGEGRCPWCIMPMVFLTDGFVEVKFKPLSGKTDQAGGLIWRFKDGQNYYVARANAKENNVALYYVEGGMRTTIKYVDATVFLNKWSTLKVEFLGEGIKVFLNGNKYIDLKDKHISGTGSVGVWTKADSRTFFDDFIFE